MSHGDDSEVLSMLQPDLLTREELVSKIQSRCKIKNLGIMSKEGLVGLFRRVNFPLPQRFYRANRRGKMLTSRRAKAGLDTRKKEKGSSVKESPPSHNRLKPPPSPTTHSHKIRLTSDRKIEKSHSDEGSLDNIVIRDRRKSCGEVKEKNFERESSPGRKITLKRAPDEEKQSSESTSSSKKRRNAIKWP